MPTFEELRQLVRSVAPALERIDDRFGRGRVSNRDTRGQARQVRGGPRRSPLRRAGAEVVSHRVKVSAEQLWKLNRERPTLAQGIGSGGPGRAFGGDGAALGLGA